MLLYWLQTEELNEDIFESVLAFPQRPRRYKLQTQNLKILKWKSFLNLLLQCDPKLSVMTHCACSLSLKPINPFIDKPAHWGIASIQYDTIDLWEWKWTANTAYSPSWIILLVVLMVSRVEPCLYSMWNTILHTACTACKTPYLILFEMSDMYCTDSTAWRKTHRTDYTVREIIVFTRGCLVHNYAIE